MNEINVFFNSVFLGMVEIKDNLPIEEVSKLAQDLLPKNVHIKINRTYSYTSGNGSRSGMVWYHIIVQCQFYFYNISKI